MWTSRVHEGGDEGEEDSGRGLKLTAAVYMKSGLERAVAGEDIAGES